MIDNREQPGLSETGEQELIKERVEFESDGLTLKGRLLSPKNPSATVLILHGAAKPPKNNPLDDLNPMQVAFANKGLGSFLFHCRGVGVGIDKSEGDYKQSTLNGRLVDSKHAWDWLRSRLSSRHTAIVAGSMGGHVASVLAAELGRDVAALALLEPAAYPNDGVVEVEELPIGTDAFTTGITGKRDLIPNSNAFQSLSRNLDLPLIVIIGENDPVLRQQTVEGYRNQTIRRGERGQFLLLPHVGHELMSAVPLPGLYQSVADFLIQKFER